ncbi:MAG TPA: SpoIIE family protein phosphatase [Candidatus Aquicultor sp.]
MVDSILEAMPGGAIVVDRNGRIAFANSQAEGTLGLQGMEILGRKLRDLPVKITVLDLDSPRGEAPLVSSLVIGKPVHDIGCIVKQSDGAASIVSASISPLKGDTGELVGVVLTLFDPIRYEAAHRTIDSVKRERLEVELAAVREFSDALNNINITINSTLEFEEVMKRVIVDATKAIGAESSAILLNNNDGWVAKYVYGLPDEFKGKRFSEKSAPHIAVAVKIKKIVTISDAYHDERVNPDIARTYRIRSMIVVPLIVRGEPIGALIFNYHSAQLAFSEHQIDFTTKLSASISLALENVRRYEIERDIADTLQEALLTVPEHVPGIKFGHLYHSATEAAKVGGDFYDLFELDGGRVGIIIGDVSGKGLGAAAFTALIKNTIQAYAYENGSPASIVARANDVVLKSIPDSMFATLFFGVLDTKTGCLTYCSAGHPPVLLKKPSRRTIQLETNSPVVGMMQNLTFVNNEVILRPGDILIGYTDGVIEARHEGRFFGEEGLVQFIEGLKDISVANLPQLIFNEIMSQTSSRLSDDLAVLCVSL